MNEKLPRKVYPTLGVFTTWFYGHYQSELFSGIEDEARKWNAQIIYFSGRALQSPIPYENNHNFIYDTALNAALDGLIIMSLLTDYCDNDTMSNFISRYKNIPVITINFSSTVGNAILANNTSGFSTLMKHLIEKHRYRKLAFVKGPEGNLDARERYNIYKSSLSASGIDLNPALVSDGSYTFYAGQDAVHLYMDERGLKPGRDIEAIVCTNDAIALGVIDALYNRGLHVPHDIAVTGFDNMNASIFPKFPLTSVKQHLREIGSMAVANILDYQPNREPLFFDTKLVIRASCGCWMHGRAVRAAHDQPRMHGRAVRAAHDQPRMHGRAVRAANDQPRMHGRAVINRKFIVYKKDLEFVYYEITRIIDNLKDLQKMSDFEIWMRNNFPILGIESAWLFLFSEVPALTRTYKFPAGYDMRESTGMEQTVDMPEKAIFNDMLLKRPGRFYCLIPLLCKEEKFGLLVMEVNRMTSFVYDTLSSHMGSSIKKILLSEEVAAKTRELIQSGNLLREANEQKTQFFINVAHETRTPLTLIQNYLMRYMQQHPPDENLLVIKQNIDLLLANMLNFLDVEKLQRGDMIYHHDTPVDLSKSAHKKCTLFEGIAGEKNIRIEWNVENGVCIRIDPWALDRILNNLLDNAIKYTQAGGWIKLDVERNEGKAILRVSDNGPGLPADAYDHIFEPYYLLSKRKTGQQGIGVGLSIVKKIIDGLGAYITAEKCSGGGACFTLIFTENEALPAQGMLQEIPATAPSPLPLVPDRIKQANISTNKHTLFIVDDNIQLLSFLQTSFETAYNVFLARDTEEALFKLGTIPRPDIIISDIMMNGPDGFQLLTAVSVMDGYNDIPFIFLTALGNEKGRIKGLNLGAVDYIEKPFSITELSAKIESIIALRKRHDIQQLTQIRSRLENLISGSDQNPSDPAKVKFELFCKKYGITGREQAIFRLLVYGVVHKEIASRLHLAPRTVEYHIAGIYKKCGVTKKIELLNKFRRCSSNP